MLFVTNLKLFEDINELLECGSLLLTSLLQRFLDSLVVKNFRCNFKLLLLQIQYIFVKGVVDDESLDCHVLRLTDTMSSGDRLNFSRCIP
ncbi:hypothetical protein AR158_c662R [Paramecium bursaria Chlorella virus AR158]|uniref:hypothetical protein n=1 Tax=Paramecium bursaria Chlorella virus AR158 TaxID=380598 RepID=UPI00015AA829|nr:hypothetical protein AR158_c662R [Paramecium bursaria Chlorella virus AR158]ABU44207.1 hypothetical protein AR158_c662R [Paramecium bursaria Chlorella virus AR158]